MGGISHWNALWLLAAEFSPLLLLLIVLFLLVFGAAQKSFDSKRIWEFQSFHLERRIYLWTKEPVTSQTIELDEWETRVLAWVMARYHDQLHYMIQSIWLHQQMDFPRSMQLASYTFCVCGFSVGSDLHRIFSVNSDLHRKVSSTKIVIGEHD